jgi:hypothetical protein
VLLLLQENAQRPCVYQSGDVDSVLNFFLLSGSNYSTNCSHDLSGIIGQSGQLSPIELFGQSFYSYFTPIILVVGIVGNSLSLNVFISKNMRSLSASTYLAVLSTTDLLTLVCYVMVEWLRRGLVYLSPDIRMDFLNVNGVCQTQLYLSYVFRFLSAWIVVAFTGERYIGVCHPLRRRDLCTKSSTRRIIVSLFVVAICLCLYKPTLSGMYLIGGRQMCSHNPNFDFLSFILDSVFGVIITLIPFVIITVLNLLIIRKLYIRNKRQNECKVITEESLIRLEFTLILLTILFFFIAFNIPYFAVWFRNFLHSKYLHNSPSPPMDSHEFEYWKGVLNITRTIFYMNYCINFFLYSITGAYFRREVRMLFNKGLKQERQYARCSRMNSNSHTTPQSWL